MNFKYLAFYFAMALIAGATVPTQAGINAKLSFFSGSPVTASIISFITGTLTLIIYALVTGAHIPGTSAFAGAPWWIWTGGILGAFFVASCIVLANNVGAVSMLALILAGQMVTSLILDHFGLLGYQTQPVTLMKAGGVVLLIAGILMIRIS